MNPFLAINGAELCRLVSRASRRVVLVGPGVFKELAEACLAARDERGVALTVIIDPDPEVCRLGYGAVEAIRLLTDSGVAVRKANGLRIGILVVDEEAWVYTPTPLVVEDSRAQTEPNAIRLGLAQAEEILQAVSPGWGTQPMEQPAGGELGATFETPPPGPGPEAANEAMSAGGEPSAAPKEDAPEEASGAPDAKGNPMPPVEGTPTEALPPVAPAVQAPLIGAEVLDVSEVAKAERDLQDRPPVKFDLQRRTRVYQSYLQFVELEVEGCEIQRHTIKLPEELMNVQGDANFKRRLKSTFRLLDRSTLSITSGKAQPGAEAVRRLSEVSAEIKKLRRDYLRSVGMKRGWVMLKKNRAAFDKAIDEIRKKLEAIKVECNEQLEQQVKISHEALINTFLPTIIVNPPEWLEREIIDAAPSEDVARACLERLLQRESPDIGSRLAQIGITVMYKDVTHEMLKDEEFRKAVSNQFPHVSWDKLYHEDDAIKAGRDEE